MSIDRSSLRTAVQAALDARESRVAQPRYWYPLSKVTFGVDEIVEALDSMCTFQTTMGEKTRQYERAFARRLGATDAVMVNSGSSADLLLSLHLVNPRAPRLQPGDEVLVPAVTWPTHVWSPMMAGLEVKLIDVDPSTLNTSPEEIARNVGPRTRAVFLVHIMGNPCDMAGILQVVKAHDLVLLEDCCESLGATFDGASVGSFGLGGAFSSFFSHHITTMEGGMVTTYDATSADELRVLRAHGWLRNVEKLGPPQLGGSVDARYTFINFGLNVRPMEVQAAFGIHQLARLDAFNARRAELAGRFRGWMARQHALRAPRVHERATPSWMALPVLVAEDAPFTRDELTAHLELHGVETRPVVAGNLAHQPAARLLPRLRIAEDLSGADVVHTRGFYVGLNPMVTDAEMDRLIETFESFLRR